MEFKSIAKHIRISPRKVRLVAALVRGSEVIKALDVLKFTNKKAVIPVDKLVNSSIANAEHNFEVKKENLYIKEIRVDEGKTLHRWMPRAHGRATPIRKRTSHVSLILAEIKESGVKEAKKQKIEAPISLEKIAKEGANPKIDIKKESKKDKSEEEVGKKIVDPRQEGRGGHTKTEGKSEKGFINKVFRRKSG